MDWKCLCTSVFTDVKKQSMRTFLHRVSGILVLWLQSPETKHKTFIMSSLLRIFCPCENVWFPAQAIKWETHTHRNTPIHTAWLSTKTFKELWSNKFTVIITQVVLQNWSGGKSGRKSVSRSLLVLRHVPPHWLRGMMSQCGLAYKKWLSHTDSRAAKTRTLRSRKTALKLWKYPPASKKTSNMCRGLDSLPVTCLERWDLWGFSDIFPFKKQ